MVLVYSVGAYAGYAAVAEPHIFPANIPRSVAIIRPHENIGIKSEYLSIFLNSNFGIFQTKRFRAGNAQPVLALEKINQFKIPKLDNIFQLKIAEMYNKSYDLRLIAKTLYKHAENILLEEIGLKDWKPTTENIEIKTFKNSFLESGRLDAEYYQPKYDEIVQKIKEYKDGFRKLSDLVSIKKSVETGSEAYSSRGIPYIRVSNLTKFGISDTDICISDKYYQENKSLLDNLKIKKDTILLSNDGSIGIAYKVSENLEMLTSGALLHLSIINKDYILPDILTLILNSEIVQLQAERDSGGSIIIHWRVSEIENILIPIIPMSIQEKISSMIQERFKLKKESEKLLEVAKKAVEIAIEENEEIAIKFIKDRQNN